KDVLAGYHPEVIRLFLLSKHYRSPIDYSEGAMDEVISTLDKIYGFLDRAQKAGIDIAGIAGDKPFSSSMAPGRFAVPHGLDNGNSQYKGNSPLDSPWGQGWMAFREAMDDDFNTARGMAALFETVKRGNRVLDGTGDAPAPQEREELDTLCRDIKHMGEVLGILAQTPRDYFESQREAGLAGSGMDPAAIDKLIMERTEARKLRDFARADLIRKRLEGMNIILEDGPDGTKWRFA
ncbi:MAG: hypothetical protein HQK66_13025, partial [Desulfamplus sp.]|nr:hypothetical protein [Desulfamplus sp.]